MNEIEKYIDSNIKKYYKMVTPKWYYNNIDYQLVKMLYKEYYDVLQYKNEDILRNIALYALAKVTRFFRDMHQIAISSANNSVFIGNVNSSMFEGLVPDLSHITFNKDKSFEQKHIEHITEVYKRATESILLKRMLKYISKNDDKVRDRHKKADGIIREASDPIWTTLYAYLGEWGCRCTIVVSDKNATKTPDKSISERKLDKYTTKKDIKPGEPQIEEFEKKTKVLKENNKEIKVDYYPTAPASTIDIKKKKLIIFSDYLLLLAEYEAIKKIYEKDETKKEGDMQY